MADRDDLPWDDPGLAEHVDGRSPWRAGCRLLQSWWRETHLALPCGPHRRGATSGFVGSTLPESAPRRSNFLSDEALDAVEERLAVRGGGLVSEDRLIRNLLSSQPLCFNLFGHLRRRPDVLLDWLVALGIDAAEVTGVMIEWAPPKAEHFDGGSAFDALITYARSSRTSGFVGIETKYAEDLREQRIDPRPPYIDFTLASGHWRPGAAERLRSATTVQLWLNTLLAQSCVQQGTNGWSEGSVVMLACGADVAAFDATVKTRTELVEPSRWIRWSPIEALVDIAARDSALADWAGAFRTRYLDFAPVAQLLPEGDRRRDGWSRSLTGDPSAAEALATSYATTRAYVDRVLGDGSVLETLAAPADPDALPSIEVATLAHRLDAIAEETRALREQAFPTWIGSAG